MIRLLCFESASDVEAFCYHYCLSVEGSDVVLDSRAYLEPEERMPQRRAPQLVEAKARVSIGEVWTHDDMMI